MIRAQVTTRRVVVLGAVALAATGLVALAPSGVAAATGASTSSASLPAVLSPPSGATVAVDQGVTHEQNPLVPAGASWTEHYYSSPQADSPTPVELHADVLRPTTVPAGARTPVILSVGPYFSHAGEAWVERTATGPSQRFLDLIEGARLMDRGYTVVLVDLRGYGGSTGCLDWSGPGEQADIRRSVEWAAAQPWSTGRVGTYGKSYDALTGLWANDLRPRGLAAVVAQEPVWNGYDYYYSNGVARPNAHFTPETYNGIAKIPPTRGDTPRYRANAAYERSHPECTQRNVAEAAANTRPSDPYWVARDTIGRAAGTTTPIFFTQGFTDSNTKPEQMQDYLAHHLGADHAWMGPWEHVRANELDPVSGRPYTGRPGFFSEVVRFYDRYLKDRVPDVQDPAFAIQGSDGAWRAQAAWPGSVHEGDVSLGGGSYVDDGITGSPTGSYKVFSRPVAVATRLTATPSVLLRTTGTGDVMVRLYDVDPSAGTGVLVNENVSRLEGPQTSFELEAMDWTLAPGHRLAVSVGTIDPYDDWVPRPGLTGVTVTSAHLVLATQSPAGDRPTTGGRSAFLDGYLSSNTVALPVVGPGSFTVPTPR